MSAWVMRSGGAAAIADAGLTVEISRVGRLHHDRAVPGVLLPGRSDGDDPRYGAHRWQRHKAVSDALAVINGAPTPCWWCRATIGRPVWA